MSATVTGSAPRILIRPGLIPDVGSGLTVTVTDRSGLGSAVGLYADEDGDSAYRGPSV